MIPPEWRGELSINGLLEIKPISRSGLTKDVSRSEDKASGSYDARKFCPH